MITAIILAAGASKRFGRNKLLETINGKPMIKWTVEAALNSMANEVVVVLGFEAEKVAEAIKDLPCKKVINENYEEGMSSSVKCGLRNAMDKSMAILIIPGDCPLIRSEDINKVIKRYLETRKPIVIATHKGRRGHPIMISRELFEEVMGISEEGMGLKEVIKRHEMEIAYAETENAGVIRDIDNPEDLKEALKLMQK
ncbi:MAG: nucleotidyltransferase family protein [archaeon YNP-LCB-003-016]|uniref:nucleotidyltransferase family protein n=1 Tax=Candidatus Culexarchaeum yellowstonense TaxID=2928963 RepID=UPI0026E967E1|nr:nucleotidyltransferase family protein [Candidatus Culexarchaeum yellowstonense]MCR6691850.1 nucleotidyltransferase family protein [Candidatus Culexarchaeum yellowstonense]